MPSSAAPPAASDSRPVLFFLSSASVVARERQLPDQLLQAGRLLLLAQVELHIALAVALRLRGAGRGIAEAGRADAEAAAHALGAGDLALGHVAGGIGGPLLLGALLPAEVEVGAEDGEIELLRLALGLAGLHAGELDPLGVLLDELLLRRGRLAGVEGGEQLAVGIVGGGDRHQVADRGLEAALALLRHARGAGVEAGAERARARFLVVGLDVEAALLVAHRRRRLALAFRIAALDRDRLDVELAAHAGRGVAAERRPVARGLADRGRQRRAAEVHLLGHLPALADAGGDDRQLLPGGRGLAVLGGAFEGGDVGRQVLGAQVGARSSSSPRPRP